MNKELFVSSTPHETKVGLVEDDLLAEIYLERENEYTLAGSIYKGRVTRVLPGMQSAFVDIGLERDAFLYVSDFMDLEEHDDELTDVVPAHRGVQDLRQQNATPAAQTDAAVPAEAPQGEEQEENQSRDDDRSLTVASSAEAPASSESPQPENGADRDRSWRGRRRRRGGRREGREGRERAPERGGSDRESRSSRSSEPRTQSGPPAGYEPILLPGESISKYQRWSEQHAQPTPIADTRTEQPAEISEATTPISATFPEDEPIFATGGTVEPIDQEHGQRKQAAEEPAESAGSSANWNREFRNPGESFTAWAKPAAEGEAHEEVHEESEEEPVDHTIHVAEPTETQMDPQPREEQAPVFAAPGTIEEETIDEEEADTIQYHASSDDSYEEFEEETQAAEHLNGDAREAVTEIHMASMAESPEAPALEPAHEDDSEEMELEEAQAQAEAMLDAEARGNGSVDAHAEVRAPSTATYTQRPQRQRSGFERPGYDRRGGRRGGRRFRRRESAPVPLISDLLKEGQEILVQIAKEPIGKKGARITSHIALPGRFLVYMPTVNHTGVSRKISSEEERQRLKRIILSERENGHGGFIVRTAAQSASEEELRADIRFLKGLWQDIKNRAENSKPPALIYHDLNVVERVLRDQVTSDFNVIWVDTEAEYERILRFFNRFQPNMVKRVKLYTKETPLFEQFGLAEEMNKALKSKVWLKSGGYIVINQTEALVAIDINTGKYVGKTQRLEDTIVKTNVDAIKEIVRQIRLRDLGGIIIIDFIDMDERRNRQRVMQALEEELRHDRAPSKTLQFNDFGLVAITRKRVKQSLERTIGAPCPYCQSTGYVKSVTTICNDIYVEMRKISKHLAHEDVMLRVHPDVAKELKSNNARLLNEMEEMTKRTIIVKSDPAVHQEQFDIN